MNIHIFVLFGEEEINTFCFTNGRCLFPNHLHYNNIIYTVKCTKYPDYRICAKFQNFLPVIRRDIPYFGDFILVCD